MNAMIIVKLIWALNLPPIERQELTRCVFYGQQRGSGVNLYERLEHCKGHPGINRAYITRKKRTNTNKIRPSADST